MSDLTHNRYNSIMLGDGTPDQGQLNLVATTRSVPYANGGGRSALVFNGAVLNAMGLAPSDASSLSDYLFGADSLSVHSGGAIINADADDITFVPPLLAAETSGGVVKRGAASLTLSATNNAWCGATDVQSGTLRARMNQMEQHIYPEGLLALWTFDDGTMADQSGNGFDMNQQNDTNLVEFTDGGFCGKAALFSGLSSLKMGYDQAFNINTFTVSVWVKLSIKDIGHEGIFSTRVNTSEAAADGTFDIKLNEGGAGSQYISSLMGLNILSGMGGDLSINTWYMITYVGTPGKVDAYLNGDLKNSISATTTLLTSGHIITLGRGHSSATEPIREMMADGGMIDDVAIYNRALSADEIAVMYETMLPRPPVSVAVGAELDLMGSTNITPTVTGGGVISDGTLVVTESLSPESGADSATLSIANLVLDGTNLVYNCSTDDETNDIIHVAGSLSVEETGTIDFGLSSAEAVSTPYRRTVMTYGTLDPADALKIEQWEITGDGANSALKRNIIVDTVNKHIDVEIRYVGTVFIVR